MQDNFDVAAYGSSADGVSRKMWVFGKQDPEDAPDTWIPADSGLAESHGLCGSNAGILPPHGVGESGLVLDFASPEPVDWLVPWWNAETAGSGSLDLHIQALTPAGWTGWYAMGTWGARSLSHSGGDENAKIETDTLRLAEPASRFRLKLTLSGACILRRCGIVARNFRASRPPTDESLLREIDNPAPRRSQKVEDPAIKGRICSPTSVSMALESLGIDFPTHFVAADCHDDGEKMYGNWSFNVASLWRLGACARLDYFPNTGMAADEFSKGRLLIGSVRFTEGVLDGAPMKSTNGHLIVIRGLARAENGDWLVLVNDPAAPIPEETPRRYLLRQFDKAWTGVAYVVEGSRR